MTAVPTLTTMYVGPSWHRPSCASNERAPIDPETRADPQKVRTLTSPIRWNRAGQCRVGIGDGVTIGVGVPPAAGEEDPPQPAASPAKTRARTAARVVAVTRGRTQRRGPTSPPRPCMDSPQPPDPRDASTGEHLGDRYAPLPARFT